MKFGILTDALCVAKLIQPRFLGCFDVVPFLISFMASGSEDYVYLSLGLFGTFLFAIVCDLGNVVADQVSDEIDYPERTQLCRRVGYITLTWIVVAGAIGLVLTVGAMALVLHIGPELVVLWVAIPLAGIAYSYGPRIKTTKLAPLWVAGQSPVFLWLGWPPTADFEGTLVPGFLIGLMALTLMGWKDLPNIAGDLAVGYRSVFWDIVERGHAVVRAMGIITIPYLVVVLLVALGYLPVRYLMILVVLPVGLEVAITVVRARSLRERVAVRELGNLYWILFMNTVLLSFYPTYLTLVVAGASIVWYVVATWWLHPDPGLLTVSSVRAIIRLLRTRPKTTSYLNN